MLQRTVGVLTGLLAVIGSASAQVQPGTAPASQAPPARVYRTVDGAGLKAFVFAPSSRPDGKRSPGVLLFHGGGWSAGDPDWVFPAAQRFADLGLVAVPIEYRLSNETTTPIDALADVCAAFQWARGEAPALGLDPERLAGYGVSAGGHLAALAATVGCGTTEGRYRTGGPDALVLTSPALDVSGDGHFKRLLRERAPVAAYSPVEHIRPGMPPVMIAHGEKDTLTPLRGARAFCDRVIAGGGRCELHIYPGVGHLFTRNLANQEDDFDPDPVARADAAAKQNAFLRTMWLR
jgi:acetyl esterase/lipase